MTFFEVSPLCNFNVIESFTELSRIVLMRHGMEKIWRPNRGKGLPAGPQLVGGLGLPRMGSCVMGGHHARCPAPPCAPRCWEAVPWPAGLPAGAEPEGPG